MTRPSSVTIIVPCYNEQPEVLRATVAAIEQSLEAAGADYEVLVVNDGSRKHRYDGIAQGRVRLVEHPENRGYGAALKTGIHEAAHEVVGITDADGTYPNHRFGELLALMEHADMVVGARPWGDISLARRLPKFLLTKLASFLADYPIQDLNSGMRLFRKEMALRFWGLYPNGFSFTSTITMGCLTSGYRLRYQPIAYAKREGKSHIQPIRDTLNFFTLVTRLTLYFNPMRVFVPLSLLFGLLATLRGLRDYWLTDSLGGLALVLFFMSFQLFFFGLLADIVVKTGKQA